MDFVSFIHFKEEEYLYRTADTMEDRGILNYLNKTEYSLKEVHYWLYLYRYAGKKELGGGVLLTLSHEINILNSFFNDCQIASCFSRSSKNFSIDAEDYVFALLNCDNIDVNFILGYSQVHEERYIKFQTHNKYVIGDLISNSVRVFNANSAQEEYSFSIERNELFAKETEYFFNCIKTREIKLNTAEESLRDILLINGLKSYKKL